MIERKLVEKLVNALQERPIKIGFVDEGDFEQRFVEPVCREVLEPALELYTHPWRDKAKKRDKVKEKRWHDSKAWGAIHGWGTAQAFDLLARDESRKGAESADGKQPSIAVEIKLAKGKKFSTGDFQRMLGQCLLASLIHEVVIGVFGYTGNFDHSSFDEKTGGYAKTLREEHGIWLVYRKVKA